MCIVNNPETKSHDNALSSSDLIVRSQRSMPSLTKSLFMSGQRCAKRLWFEVHQPLDVQEAVSMQLINGRELDRIAQSARVGVIISRDQGLTAAAESTKKALAAHEVEVLYQAAFRWGELAVITDVLRRNGTGFDLIENKVSTHVKDEHLMDAAFQALVLERAGMRLKRTFIGHVNKSFRLRKSGEYDSLVTEQNVTSDVRRLKKIIRKLAEMSLSVMASPSAPDVAMGEHCESPYPCPFMNRCRAALSPGAEFPVSLLPRGGKTVAALLADGISDLRAVPPERLKSRLHQRVYAATLSGEPFFDASASRRLRALKAPYSYLDFETLPLGVPRVIGTRPYEQCPFQWSLHIEEADGSVRHLEHLSTSLSTGLEALVRALLDALPSRGPIFVYNAALERSALTVIARLLPGLRPSIGRMVRRLVDLLPITRAAYYHPLMRGSWSIKEVLPTIDATLAYERLTEVRDGSAAQAAYLQYLDPQIPPKRRSELETRLKEYCGHDTYALVVLRRFLCQRSTTDQ